MWVLARTLMLSLANCETLGTRLTTLDPSGLICLMGLWLYRLQ